MPKRRGDEQDHHQPEDDESRVSDEQKERGAHVFLSAWKIWLEKRRRKRQLNGHDRPHPPTH